MSSNNSRKLMIAITTAALGTALAGCANGKFATFESAGQSLPQAQYQVLGKTRYDQLWIDKTIEAEVVGFGHKRPGRRPPELDARPRAIKAVIIEPPEPTAPLPKAAPVVTIKKPTVWQRVRHPIKTYRERQ